MTATAIAECFNIATHNGNVTIHNKATRQHRTFQIKTVKSGPLKGKRIVALLVGPDNWANYKGFGFVNADGSVMIWSKHRGQTSYSVFADMLRRPAAYVQRGCEYLFSGKCRICNKKLTVPESIKSGIGPICAGRL